MSFVFVFFKQKTAYEMRISDWSSDVCSSDLFSPSPGPPCYGLPKQNPLRTLMGPDRLRGSITRDGIPGKVAYFPDRLPVRNEFPLWRQRQTKTGTLQFESEADTCVHRQNAGQMRSEERRVGKEGVSKGRSRGA